MELPVRRLLKMLKRWAFSYACLIVCWSLLFFVALMKMTNGSISVQRGKFLFNASKSKATTLETPVHFNPPPVKKLTSKSQDKVTLNKWLNERIERLNKEAQKVQMRREVPMGSVKPNYKVHIFYYAWYENVDHDEKWEHWNHEYLQNWKKYDKKVYPTGRHTPPDDIGSNFYPSLGCYSSRDPATIDIHMQQLRDTGVGVLVVSWYPPGMSDGTGQPPDLIFSKLLDVAAEYDLKIIPHVEPYTGRNPVNFRQHLKYFTDSYGHHPALYKFARDKKEIPVYYIYDSYRTPSSAWKELLGKQGNISIRGTSLDGIFLGLLVDIQHKHEIKRARFDGFYTYFASIGFSYGSIWKNWKSLSIYARNSGLLFSPSIGPGYVDTRIRPWNVGNTKHRQRGKYYEVGWRAALSAEPDFYSVTSFNEWHEGTQIEPAVAKAVEGFTYVDYEPEGPNFYLNLTNWWIRELSNRTNRQGRSPSR